MDEPQRRLVYRYLIARVGLRNAELPSIAILDHQMKNEVRVLAGGIVIDRTRDQPIMGDEQDAAFFAAIVQGDASAIDISAPDLEQTRGFVLHDKGSLPPPLGRDTRAAMAYGRTEQLGVSRLDGLLPSDLETRKAAGDARWGTSGQ